jgi:hypothetical protein
MDVTIPCVCPPRADGQTRHTDGDTITLRERLDFRAALTARNTMVLVKTEDPDASTAEILAALTETYLLAGIESWSLVDAKNKAVVVSKTAIRECLLTHPDEAMTAGNAADELYSASVILPLVALAQTSSPPTPTTASTSAPRRSSAKRPRRSKPSSITPFPMDATGTTSLLPAGASSSSRSSG